MAFKMRGFNAGKGTGLTQNKSKSGGGSKDARPQKAPGKATGSAMKMGMRSNAMAGRDPNMAMKASNAMLPGSMMAMKANRSAMTLKDDAKKAAMRGGTEGLAETMSSRAANQIPNLGTKKTKRENRKLERTMSKSTAKGEDRKTRRQSAMADREIRKAGESKAKSPMPLKDRPTGMKKDPDYYKRDNFMDVKAEAKQAADRKAYGPEGAPATVKPKKGRDTLRTAIPQSTIGKRLKEKENKFKRDERREREQKYGEGRRYGKKESSMTLKDVDITKKMMPETKVSKEERMKQVKAQGKAMREGRLKELRKRGKVKSFDDFKKPSTTKRNKPQGGVRKKKYPGDFRDALRDVAVKSTNKLAGK